MRAAIVGTGYIAVRKHIPAFRRAQSAVSLDAVVDIDGEAAQRVSREFGIPRFYSDVSEMLAREKPDFVDICTPPLTHALVALQAIAAGSHVLIEKPMAMSLEECDAIMAAAEDQGVQVCVAHSDLFYPPFARARRLVSDGALGEFHGMRIFLSTPTTYMTSQDDHWAHALPGGVIGESGPHVVYMTLAFIDPIVEVRACGSRVLDYPWSRFDDYRIDLVGERATSSITAVYNSDQWAAQVDLWGSRGLVRLDLETMALVRQRRRTLGRLTVGASGVGEAAAVLTDTVRTGVANLTKRYRSTHDVLIEGFARSIAMGSAPPVTAHAGREAVRVMALIAEQLDGPAKS